jgi:hypothetical protein
MEQEELDRRFVYHPPGPKVREVHDDSRRREYEFATYINSLPGGDTREKNLAYTALEQCVFWIHAHIARNLTEETA